MELLLTRRPDEGFELRLEADTDPYDLIDALWRGGIRVRIKAVKGNQVKIGVEAPFCLRVERYEEEI